jgi:hypothetical protein
VEQLYRQAVRTRALHFRASENPAQLEQLFKELDLAAAKANATLQQGVLWLASRVQQAAIGYLQSGPAKIHTERVLEGVSEKRNALTRPLGTTDQLSLERVEAVLAAFARGVMGPSLSRFEMSALAGHLLERVREAARKPPELQEERMEVPEEGPETALFSALVEPVRAAELNEARARYGRLGDEERNRRYNDFRRRLLRVIAKVAPYAPLGFEHFCQAIEVELFPYPEPLEFIRTFARTVYQNASQSTLFDDAATPQSVEQRYENLLKSRQGNPLVLEIAKAFALRNFQKSNKDAKQAFMRDLDLQAEFRWPVTLEALKAQLKGPGRPS